MVFKKHTKLDENILKNIYSKSRISRYLKFIIGILIVALTFNIFILPNKLVYGVSGVAVMFKELFNATPSLVILIGSILLLILSFILLGYEKTRNSIIGSILYPIMVELTLPLVKYIDLGSTEPIVLAVFGAVLSGIGLGLIFKSGFTTGGTDILNQIVAKYFKMSIGNAMFFTDGLIIFSSLFILGWQNFIYSVIVIYIISVMTDKVILGISQSKTIYVITDHETEVKQFILKHLSHGVTVLDGRGGFTGNSQKVIMCIIPTKEYFLAKEGIREIDGDAFVLATDAYEVLGGK